MLKTRGPRRIKRKISGKTFLYSGFHLHKKDARANAEHKRKQGAQVRVLPGPSPWQEDKIVYNIYMIEGKK